MRTSIVISICFAFVGIFFAFNAFGQVVSTNLVYDFVGTVNGGSVFKFYTDDQECLLFSDDRSSSIFCKDSIIFPSIDDLLVDHE